MEILSTIKQPLSMKVRRIVHRMIANGLINENDNKQDLRIVIRAEDKELENIFNQTKSCRI